MRSYKIILKDNSNKVVNADSYKIENGFFIFEDRSNSPIFSIPTDQVNTIENLTSVNESTYNSSEMLCD